ncbi:MAG TPA: DegT/DnrJ/EryC1/StrS family aminotransferase [Candidatus Polarisedimenticolia bacterium]|nr:DegT/DnrJ/EryC1/StrS family aminotransferase [Candidatus Polarisedimenticolia bacterium]
MTTRYHIPFFQPLAPLDLLTLPRDLHGTFPFSAPRRRHYYLARNAIWHGIGALGLGRGEGVLMPAYHHGVDLDVVLGRGLVPTFYRIDQNARMDLEDLERQMKPGIRVLYIIHYFGFPQPIEEAMAFARRHGLVVIEDCALSLFSATPQAPLGSFGDIGIFCLYKTLPLPHGGTLALNRAGLEIPPRPEQPDRLSAFAYIANLLLDYVALRLEGMGPRLAKMGREMGRSTKRAMKAATVPIDTNELDASVIPLGMGNAARYILARTRPDEVVRIRRENYLYLRSILDPGVRPLFPELPEGTCPLSLPILVQDKQRVHEELYADGVGNVNFWFVWRKGVPAERFPEVTFLRHHVLEIPIHQGLGRKHMDFIAEKVNARGRW